MHSRMPNDAGYIPMDATVAIFGEPQPEIISLQDALQGGVTDLEKLPIAPAEGTGIVEFDDIGHINQNEQYDMFGGELDLEDLIDTVTLLQCRFCQYSCAKKNLLMTHIKTYHREEVRDLVKQEYWSQIIAPNDAVEDENILGISTGKEELQKEAQRLEQDEMPQVDIGETTIYLCSFCNCTFEQFAECENHMKIEHYQCAAETKKVTSEEDSGSFSPPVDHVDPELAQSASVYTSHDPRDPHEIQAEIFQQELPRRFEAPDNRSFRCPQRFCPQKFRSEEALNYHKRSHLLRIILSDQEKDQEEESLRSNDKACNTEFPSGINQLYKCPECGVRIFSWRNTVSHLWRKHQVDCDQYSCKVCEYKTPSYYKLLTHNQIHSDRRNYVCVTCGKDYKQLAQLRNHMIVHKDKKAGEIKNSWYSPKVCDFCQRTFSSGRCLKKHIETVHMKMKNFACETCGHQAARKSMLMIHMRLHTGEKPYVCDYEGCGYRTCDHNSLRRHKMQHSGEKPYKCPHCPYACIQSISYKRHIRTKHPEVERSNVFECHRCSFRTINEDKMAGHIAVHEDQDRLDRGEQMPGLNLQRALRRNSDLNSSASCTVAQGDGPVISREADSTLFRENITPLGTYVVIPYGQDPSNDKTQHSIGVDVSAPELG
ncbi:zinc finger protein 135-like [Galendromus occidentalis]|uniref:Zinc finger protein 135-like n=1 Tax=Galendromus occidentalis TaxID=34638 RepID=A0AAJ7SJP9_9ACAR|nr:zinc finger protein 135-like [Galendromus occidentalis]